MAIDQKFIDQFVKVTSKAALASYHLVGQKDKVAADKAAVDQMRTELNKIDMEGEVVIGEGELDEAPMLFIGEKLGTKKGPKLDIAVDPSKGSTAISSLGPFLVPSFSPIKSIGASSSSPSPITISPSMSILFNSVRILSTAALSAATLSFFPTK